METMTGLDASAKAGRVRFGTRSCAAAAYSRWKLVSGNGLDCMWVAPASLTTRAADPWERDRLHRFTPQDEGEPSAVRIWQDREEEGRPRRQRRC